MSDNITKEPAIRFKGFTDPWEQRKLSDVKDVRDGTHDSPKYFQQGHPLVTSKNLTDSGLDMSEVSLISDEDFEAINKRSKVDVGDIIFGMIGTIGNPVIVDRSDFAIKNVALIKGGGKVPNIFLIQLLKSPIFKRYILSENAGGTQKFLGLSKIRDYNLFAPSIDEMSKIGGFYANLDTTITLQQRELDLMKQEKQTLLSKMFPKNGEQFPELRFKGFTDPWEQRKLGEEAEILAGGDIDKDRIQENGKYPVLANALTNDGVVGYYDDSFRVEAPAVTVTGRGDVGHAQARKTCFTPVVRLLAVKSNHDVDFLEAAINHHSVLVESTGVPQLTSPQLKNYKIKFPTLEEEKKIGEFLISIDQAITLQQRELELMKTMKKSLLKAMFV